MPLLSFIWLILVGRPRVKQLENGTLRLRVAGIVFEANTRDELMVEIGRDRDRLAQQLSEARLASGPMWGGASSDWRGIQGNYEFNQSRRLERSLRSLDNILADLARES